MQGIGNDYIYINAIDQRIDEPEELARQMADRHFGVGGDGIILILPPPEESTSADTNAHVRMRMFNADGSESEMCGNGIRCVCKFVHDQGISTANPLRVQTSAGILSLDYQLDDRGKVSEVTVDMGEPILDLPRIPVLAAHVLTNDESETRGVYGIEIGEMRFPATFVSMGNPHAVIYTRHIAEIDLESIGPQIEHHPAFPKRINVHFVHVHDRDEVTMRTWERGSGITMACGTGASAVCVAGAKLGLTNREILAHLPGGDLTLRWDEATNHVYKTGPATEVFRGEWG
jgi:diaminopimelate epimerase